MAWKVTLFNCPSFTSLFFKLITFAHQDKILQDERGQVTLKCQSLGVCVRGSICSVPLGHLELGLLPEALKASNIDRFPLSDFHGISDEFGRATNNLLSHLLNFAVYGSERSSGTFCVPL